MTTPMNKQSNSPIGWQRRQQVSGGEAITDGTYTMNKQSEEHHLDFEKLKSLMPRQMASAFSDWVAQERKAGMRDLAMEVYLKAQRIALASTLVGGKEGEAWLIDRESDLGKVISTIVEEPARKAQLTSEQGGKDD